MFWDVNVDGFQVGPTLSKKFAKNGYSLAYDSTATLDTGTSLLYIPTELYHTILHLVMKGKLPIMKSGSYWGTCDLT